jgi:hypothetical protein
MWAYCCFATRSEVYSSTLAASHEFLTLPSSAKVLQQTEEVIRVARQGAEAEMFVERTCFVILGVNSERANAGDVRGLQCSLHGVLEHAGAEALALPGYRARKTGEEHDGNRVTGEALGQTLRSRVILDLPDDQRIVAGDSIVAERDICLRSSCLLVLERVTNEKAVESFPATIESIDLVAALELLDLEWDH